MGDGAGGATFHPLVHPFGYPVTIVAGSWTQFAGEWRWDEPIVPAPMLAACPLGSVRPAQQTRALSAVLRGLEPGKQTRTLCPEELLLLVSTTCSRGMSKPLLNCMLPLGARSSTMVVLVDGMTSVGQRESGLGERQRWGEETVRTYPQVRTRSRDLDGGQWPRPLQGSPQVLHDSKLLPNRQYSGAMLRLGYMSCSIVAVMTIVMIMAATATERENSVGGGIPSHGTASPPRHRARVPAFMMRLCAGLDTPSRRPRAPETDWKQTRYPARLESLLMRRRNPLLYP